MKDEIKEILDLLYFNRDTISNGICHVEDFMSREQIIKLLDYITNLKTIEQQYSSILSENAELENKITNLQEENERLKEIVENLTTMTVCGDRKQIKNTAQYKLDIYKSRNEKAIEYIMTELITEWDIKNDGYVSGSDLPVDAITPLLNILKGEDKDGNDFINR